MEDLEGFQGQLRCMRMILCAMLGWLHQALASERELLMILLDPESTGETRVNHFSRTSEIDSAKNENDMTLILDRIFEGACRPFRIRVEQVLQSQPSLIVSYKLTNTLEFYNYTISDLLGRETTLCRTIWLLRDASQQTFFNILKTRGEKLLKYPSLVSVDLSPPLAVREGTSLMLELIDTYNGMMVPASGKRPEFEPVTSALLDPIVQMCEQAAEAYKSKGTLSRRSRTSSDSGSSSRDSISVDAMLINKTYSSIQDAEASSKIYLINCLSAIQQPLVGHEVAANYVNNLASAIEMHVSALTEREVERF